MAASDQFYRNQKTLNVIFAVSSVGMLFSILLMFYFDHNRPWKTEQRTFYDVEEALAQRLALETVPSEKEFDRAVKAVEEAKEGLDKQAVDDLQKEIDKLVPLKDKAELTFQDLKSSFDSQTSLYHIAVDKHGKGSEEAEAYRKSLEELSGRLDDAQSKMNNYSNNILFLQKQVSAKRERLTAAITKLNQLHDKFDNAVRLAVNKRWTAAHVFRSLPIIDGFASPVQVKQYTITDIPIDYNFAHVTRFDRCTTCHLGIGKAQFTRDNLHKLTEEPSTEMRIRFGDALKRLKARRKALEGTDAIKLLPKPEDLQLTYLKKSYLTETRVNQFCVHPRLDLYVGPTSPHPAEKFGCTSCHRGQGSGVQFNLSSHDPNSHEQKVEWKKEFGWERNHYWDYPMLPQRFVEASCVKCHHQMTDLITADNRNEAPKLLHGYNIVKQVGCYGCHEINGWKDGRQVGPDLRLEPSVPFEQLSKAEQEKIKSDPNNNPGDLRKVGPSLYRLAEKTDEDWTAKWLRSPRSFRPDTKMPHFYGVSNNDPLYLPEEQKEFPDTEIRAVTYYLFEESQKHLKEIDKLRDAYEKDSTLRAADKSLVARLAPQKRLSREEQREYDEARARLRLSKDKRKLTRLVGTTEKQWAELKKNANLIEGRKLFTEKGCLACHQHASTAKGGEEKTKVGGKMETLSFPDVKSDAIFGPDLSQIKEKLVRLASDDGNAKEREAARERARVWLSNWIKNPNIHSPRTKMPIVPMTDQENLHIVQWLLNQEATGLGVVDEVPVREGRWRDVKVSEPKKDVYYKLAKVYLKRVLSAERLAELDEHRDKFSPEAFKALEGKDAASYEGEKSMLNRFRLLSNELPEDEGMAVRNYGNFNKIKYYVGKKAVGRLGCYACHSVPGFDNAKPIGVGLNDWGKKDPERLAFEDAHNFVKTHYRVTPDKTDKNGNPYPPELGEVHGAGDKTAWKEKYPYEEFFESHLHHHHRLGYLHQKLINPRSYDYNRIRAWDDRSRMPKFKFSRNIRRKGHYVTDKEGNQKWEWTEGEEEFKARRWQAETDAREAVMTFVLGLVAEKIPPQSIHQPKGDKLARVRGRQILEKYNCAGCHVIRPGMYEIEMTEDNVKQFMERHTKFLKGPEGKDDYNYAEHHAWFGRENRGTGNVRKLYGLFEPQMSPDGKLQPRVVLTEAFRFQYEGKAEDGKSATEIGNIRPSATVVPLDPKTVQYPPKKYFQTSQGIREYLQSDRYGKYGGAFLDLLASPPTKPGELNGYLLQMYPEKYQKKWEYAAFAGPPWLLGQGARTQPEWLNKFLLNPVPIRAGVVLRMPKFNMSPQEAKDLVAYFAAVEKLTNPRTELEFPYAEIPQKASFDSEYWLSKNREYVDRLKNTKIKVDGKELLAYEHRLDLLRPIWKDMAEEKQAELKKQLEAANSQITPVEKDFKTADQEAKKAKAEYDSLKAPEGKKLSEDEQKRKTKALNAYSVNVQKAATLKAKLEPWYAEREQLKKSMQQDHAKELEVKWESENAYIVDSYRLVGNNAKNAACIQCHQVGKIYPTKAVGQGPPLSLASQRLRPGWSKRWIANPMRIMYHSVMPAYFPSSKNNQFEDWLVGSAEDRVVAARDFLMIYDRALQLPTNRRLVEIYRQPREINIQKKGD